MRAVSRICRGGGRYSRHRYAIRRNMNAFGRRFVQGGAPAGTIHPPTRKVNPAMNPINAVSDLTKALTFPFKFVFVVGLCTAINWLTSPGHWWVQWVALGMGIALLCIWARALRTIVTAAAVAAIGYLVFRWWSSRSQASRNTADMPPATR